MNPLDAVLDTNADNHDETVTPQNSPSKGATLKQKMVLAMTSNAEDDTLHACFLAEMNEGPSSEENVVDGSIALQQTLSSQEDTQIELESEPSDEDLNNSDYEPETGAKVP